MSLEEKPKTSEQAAFHTKLKPCRFKKSIQMLVLLNLNISFGSQRAFWVMNVPDFDKVKRTSESIITVAA